MIKEYKKSLQLAFIGIKLVLRYARGGIADRRCPRSSVGRALPW